MSPAITGGRVRCCPADKSIGGNSPPGAVGVVKNHPKGGFMTKEELVTLFNQELFISDLKAKTRDAVLEELVDRAVETGHIRDRDLILDILKKREALGSTGLGNGTAFPHGRSLATPELLVLFARSKKGVDYGAVDGKPVHLFFMFIAPPVEKANRYLPALGQVVELIREEEPREALKKAATFEDFIQIIGGGEV